MGTHGNNISTSPTKRGAAPRGGSTKGRMTDPLRNAIRIRIEQGLTIKAACDQAGLSEAGYHAAMLKPHVQQFANQAKAEFIQEVDAERALYKRHAYRIAHEMATQSDDPKPRQWAVEFLTRDDAPRKGDAPQVSVNIAQGYEFVRPGQRVVDLIDGTAPDTVSGAGSDDNNGTSTG